MAKTKCPKCGVSTQAPEGGEVHCPKCKYAFKAPNEPAVAAGLPPQSKTAKKAAPRLKPAAKSSSALVWVLVAVLMLGVLLVGVVAIAGVAVVVLYATPQKQMAVAEKRNDPEMVKEKLGDKDFALDKDKGKELKDREEIPPDRNRAIIKEVMKGGFNRDMTRNFTLGTATPEQKEQMIALFTDFAGTRSPNGNNGDWNKRTAALLAAVKADDRKGFQVASNCAGCHREHKGRK